MTVTKGNKSVKSVLGKLLRNDEALAVAIAATTGAVIARFPKVINILSQSHVFLDSNGIVRPPASHILHTAINFNAPVSYAVITASFITGGLSYASLKLLRKDKKE